MDAGDVDAFVPAASRWVPKWAVGENVEALWRDDGQWYRGWIEGLDFVTRTYTIIFETYMNRQDQTRDSQIRPDSSPGTARTAVADFLISPALLSGRTPSPPPTTAPSLAPIAVSVAAHAAPAAPQSHPRSDSDALRISQPKGPDGGALAAMASQFDQLLKTKREFVPPPQPKNGMTADERKQKMLEEASKWAGTDLAAVPVASERVAKVDKKTNRKSMGSDQSTRHSAAGSSDGTPKTSSRVSAARGDRSSSAVKPTQKNARSGDAVGSKDGASSRRLSLPEIKGFDTVSHK